MSEKVNKIPSTRRELDARPYIEIWYSLPAAGQQMLLEMLRKEGFTMQGVNKWLHGSVPRPENVRKLQKALKSCFGINTRPYTLFPGKEATEYLICKYSERGAAFGGTKEWKTRIDNEEE